ncbi:hypothetical protein [Nocardioides sp.]|uniref:hypothetical protein n=1 Tax=Nocardioides sp. TaxID=35761 RepID=UPI0037848038
MKTVRTFVTAALGAGLALSPSSAHAHQGGVPDPSGDSYSPATDITRLQVHHGGNRVTATITMPEVTARRLSTVELLLQPRGAKRAYGVTVMRNRRGKVVDKSLGWRPVNNPVEPTLLRCSKIRTSLHGKRATVSVATSCLRKSRPSDPLRAKVRTIDGTMDLYDAYYDDQTRFTGYLHRGRTQSTEGPRGRVTAKNGLLVRSLPTMFSSRQGKLQHGHVYPLTCRVTGSVVHRGNDEDGRVSNVWYRLPGAAREWVSAMYVRPIGGAPPYCGTGRTYRGRVTTATLIPREAPTTRANSHGGLTRGTLVHINCKLRGQEVRGNSLWYNLPHGLWVSARYVSNVGAVPAYCTH